MAATVAFRESTATLKKVMVGNRWHCWGKITFGASDTYATGGFDVRSQIKALFAVGDVECIDFNDGMADWSGGTKILTAKCVARYDYATGKILLYLIGRSAAASGAAQVSEVEVGNGASINAGTLEFVATCSNSGSTL